MYIAPERRRKLMGNPHVRAATAGDLSFLLYLAASYDDPRKPRGYGQYFDRFAKAIDRYLPEQIHFVDYATVFGSLEIVRRELERKDHQFSWEARKALELFMEKYFYDHLEPHFEQRIRTNGDI